MTVGDNNPRVFAQTVTLDAWRTPFDGQSGEADLHIDVVFDDRGRVGGERAPIRFRLSLRRAEVHVMRDSESIMDITRSSVRRARLPEPGRTHHLTEKKAQLEGGIEAELSAKSASLSARAKSKGNLTITDTLELNDSFPIMEVAHWRTNEGYGFKIASKASDRLKGQPWSAGTPLMKIRDTNAKRKRGEPPEIRIEIRCLREDLVIEDVEFTDSSFPKWATLPRKKQIAVEQYIKDELARAGLPCGDLSEPFARITLADAVPATEP